VFLVLKNKTLVENRVDHYFSRKTFLSNKCRLSFIIIVDDNNALEINVQPNSLEKQQERKTSHQGNQVDVMLMLSFSFPMNKCFFS